MGRKRTIEDNVVTTIRLPRVIAEKVVADADKQNRSAAYIVREILEKHYKE